MYRAVGQASKLSVMAYGCEIWSWKEQKGLEKIQMDYYRWVLRLDFCTPRYIIYEETKVEILKIDWAGKAVKFEDKIRILKESRLIKICCREMCTDKAQSQSQYNQERMQYFNSLGLSEMEVENMRRAGKSVQEEGKTRDKDIFRQINREKIRDSKYNTRYRELVAERLPLYLRKYKKEIDIDIIAKLRCRNLERINKYWLKDEDKLCRLCKKERETLEHVVVNCAKSKEIMEKIREGGRLRLWKLVNEVGNIAVVKVFKKLLKEVDKKEKEKENEM